MSMTKGTPASSQIITLEMMLAERDAEIEQLRAALHGLLECAIDSNHGDVDPDARIAAAHAALDKVPNA